MRTLFMLVTLLSFYSCVQDEGKISNASVDNGSTTGTTSGGTTGTTTGGGTPSDPLYKYQWHLNNTGQDVGSFVKLSAGINTTPTPGIDINAEQVHNGGNGYTGKGVKIVISDSGTHYTHQDLEGNFLPDDMRNYSFVDPLRWDDANADAAPSGNAAHGTAVAGITSMVGWNDIGGRGVAPGAKFTAFKYILGDTAHSLQSDIDREIHSLNAPYDVFNFSYGYLQCFFREVYDPDLKAAYEYGVTTLRGTKGAIYVQSAGNDFDKSYCGYDPRPIVDPDPTNPDPVPRVRPFPYSFGNTNHTADLTFPEKVITAAVAADGIKASYSSPGSGVWVSGLGGEGSSYVNVNGNDQLEYVPAIYTTDIPECNLGFSIRYFIYKLKNPFNWGYDDALNPNCDYTNEMNGTSSAAPIVTGVVALMLEANPALTWRDVKYILADTATVIDYDPADNELFHPLDSLQIKYFPYVYDYKWISNFTGKMFSNWYGFGLVNAQAAVAAALSWSPGTLGTYKKTETAGTWNHVNNVAKVIPDADLTNPGVSVINGVQSLTVEAVQIRLTTNHRNPEQLAVHLVSPSGTESRLILVDNGTAVAGVLSPTYTSTTYYFQSNAFWNEDSGGTWTLKVYDPEDLTSWDYMGTATDPTDDMYAYDSNKTFTWAVNIHGR